MARIAEVRDAAAPSSSDQHARVARIIEVATALAAEKEVDRVQMTEVAKAAGVAIGTLYRYFPSKQHLFVAVMVDQIETMASHVEDMRMPGSEPKDAVYAVLQRAMRVMLRRPMLSQAMIKSASMAPIATIPDVGRIDSLFLGMLMHAAGVENPTEQDVRAIRVTELAWFGALQSLLNGRTALPDAEQDLRLLCDRVLGAVEPDAAARD